MTPEQLEAKVATGIAKRIAAVVRDVCELPDRSSPDDWPEVMLVTPGELMTILIKHFGAADQPAAVLCYCCHAHVSPLDAYCGHCGTKLPTRSTTDQQTTPQPEAARPLHYWTGYGTLCFTADARKRDSQVAPDRSHVTCARCLTLLAQLDGNATPDQQSGCEHKEQILGLDNVRYCRICKVAVGVGDI